MIHSNTPADTDEMIPWRKTASVVEWKRNVDNWMNRTGTAWVKKNTAWHMQCMPKDVEFSTQNPTEWISSNNGKTTPLHSSQPTTECVCSLITVKCACTRPPNSFQQTRLSVLGLYTVQFCGNNWQSNRFTHQQPHIATHVSDCAQCINGK